ncbi:MAG: ABC transporter permease, partial [Myxococcota bacterium]
LGRLRGQLLTIALVVAAGIAAFVAMRGNYRSLLYAKNTYYERSRFADIFVHLEQAPMSLAADLARLEGVAVVEPRISEMAMLPLADSPEPIPGQILSLPPRTEALNRVTLVEGRRPEPGRDDELVLRAAFARAHQIAIGDAVPVVINGRRRELVVVGTATSPEFVMAMGPGDMSPDPTRFGVLWMAQDVLAAASGLDGAFNDVTFALQPGASPQAVIDAIDLRLEPYGGLGAIVRAKQSSNFIIEGELLQLSSMSTVVPGIFLAVAAFLLNVVLSRLVQLQRQEIATLKAVGYGNREVGAHFFKLVALIALIGAAVGVGVGHELGSRLTALYGAYFAFPDLVFLVDARTWLSGVGISLGAASVGAMGAVQRVVKLAPAEAMRPPAPARYRQTLLDRIGRWLGPAASMVQRELSRRPVRALASSAAISASMGLMVVGGWYADGLQALMYTQFHEVMREDAVVTLTQPRPARVLQSLRALPGVLHAEGMRTVPVRFRNGASYRDASIFGYREDTTLRTPRDRFGRAITLPTDGVMLTEMLGQLLDVRVGDTIEVQIREGERANRRVTVTGFIDDSFGLQGHMRESSLLELLVEPPTISIALLRVDPLEEAKLQDELKSIPYVASMSRRSEILERFRSQSGAMIATMTTLIMVFAMTITVGVVYNNARVALSMRSRDLASMRVLGFSRREISGILIGEMAVIVLAAIPAGLWFGRQLIAGIASTVDPETYRLPIVVSDRSYALAAAVAIGAALVSALLVRRRLDRLDLISVLKTRA